MLLQDARLSLRLAEFKVTACHAMRGSGSTEINVMEGGAIPAVGVAMDDNVSAELRIGSDIIESNVTEVRSSVPPVEFKVTACHAMRGSGSTEINVMEGGAIPAVAMDLMYVEQRGSGMKDGSTLFFV
jgi:predicted small secreted protein